MKVKTIKAVEAYRALKVLKVGGLSDEAMLAVWKNLKTLRPVSEAYDKDIEEVRATLQDEEFEKMQQRVKEAQELERKVKEEDRDMTAAEKREIAEITRGWQRGTRKARSISKSLLKRK